MGQILNGSNELLKGKVSQEQFDRAFDWQVEKRTIYTDVAQRVDGFFATVRKDTDGKETPLGIVKSRYEIISQQVVKEHVDSILGVGAGIPYDYELYKGGARFAFRLLFPKYLTPNVEDRSNFLQLCLSVKGSHDGSSGLVVEVSPILRYCENGLFSLGGAHAVSRVRHSANAKVRLDEIRGLFGEVEEEFQLLGEQLTGLSKTPFTGDRVEEYVKDVFEIQPNVEGEISARSQEVIDEVDGLYRNGRGNQGKTLWDAYQGLVEYVDYYRGSDETRGWNKVAGSGVVIKRRALELALKLV